MVKFNLRPWAMWFFVLSFFTYQFIMRLYPGLVMHDIMDKFQVDATAFGFLSSMYYLGYAPMQIPVAMLLDKFGPRKIVSLFALICSLATLIFVQTSNWYLLLFARFLIGFGSAVGFLGTSKVISMVFPTSRYAPMVGLSFTIGIMGALYGGRPTSVLVKAFGWESTGAGICIAGCLIALSIYSLVRVDTPASHKQEQSEPIWSTLRTLITTPSTVFLAIANLLMCGALEGFADVWGVTYLMKVYGFERAQSASIISFLFIGMLVGGPLLATVAERFKAYRTVTASCGFMISGIFSYMLLNNGELSWITLSIIMCILGILCCYQVLVFAIGSTLMPLALMGITVAFLNSINMFGGTFFHSIIGILLDLSWNGAMDGSLRAYSAENFRNALFAIPVASAIGGMMVLMVRGKNKAN